MGTPGFKFDSVTDLNIVFGHKLIKPRSYALLCTEQSQKEFRNKKWIFEFGERKPGDFLVQFQNGYGKIEKLKNPEFTFDFHDSQVNITHLVLTSNVSYLQILSY